MPIEHLDYSKSKLTEFPAEICTHLHLKSLILGPGSGWNIYPPLSALPWVMKNPILGSLPDCLGKLSELEELDLSALGIKSLAPSFFNLLKLENLNLSFNGELAIGSYVEEFAGLRNLKRLNIGGCLEDADKLKMLQDKRPDLHIYATEDLRKGSI